MATVAIVYFSGNDHTHLMAESLSEGVKAAGVTAQLLRIQGEQIKDGRWQDEGIRAAILAADAIVFGSPTYMGGVAAQLKACIDGLGDVWFEQGLKDKVAGGFTHSSSPSGDKQGTLLYLVTNALQHGMVWVGAADLPSPYIGKDDGVNRLGSFLGVMGYSPLDMSGGEPQMDKGDRLTAHQYGQRVAAITQKLKS
ncbi:MAG: flavodoxin family protein [Cyanobacteria bacterium J06636_16]